VASLKRRADNTGMLPRKEPSQNSVGVRPYYLTTWPSREAVRVSNRKSQIKRSWTCDQLIITVQKGYSRNPQSPVQDLLQSKETSVHLDAPVYPSYEHVSRQEPYRPRGQRVHRTRQRAVAEKQETAHESLNVQPRGIVPRRVHKDPEA
jgi:hypothetical protein